MRPRYLEIEGLQSFKEAQTIDFDRLGETGLFGIFGATGSGKSTILDALTLALYGNVQRANRGTQGIINTSAANVRVSFIFDLVKANKRKTYKVERVYRRKKDSENSIESRVARLIELGTLGDVVIADKQGEVNEAVIELIGLQFDDFTRSVVLPQNKFQEFLLSPKGDKTKMLERIFYLEEYGRELTDKVNRRLGRIRNKLSGISGALSMLGDISDSSLKDAEISLCESAEHKKITDKALKAAEAEYNSAKEVWELSLELKAAVSRQEELHAMAAEIDSIRSRCKNAAAAQSLAERISDIRETDLELKKTVEELGKLNTEYKELTAELEKADGELKKASRVRQERIPLLVEHRTKLTKALQTKSQLEKVEEILQRLRNEHILLKKKVDSWNESIAKEKSKLEETLAKAARHYSIKSAYYELKLKKMDMENLKLMRHSAFELAQKLKDNLPCPVCGSAEHPNPAVYLEKVSEEEEEKIKKLQETIDELEKQHNDLPKNKEDFDKELQALESKISELRGNIEKAEAEKKLDEEKLSENTAEGRGFKYQKEEKEKELQVLLGGKDIKIELESTEEEMNSLTKAEQKAQEYVNAVRESYEKTIKDKKVYEKQRDIYGEKLKNGTERLDKELTEKGFESVESVEDAFMTKEELFEQERVVREYEDASSNIKAHREVIEKRLSGRSITEESWQEISRRYEELKLEKDNSIAVYESARNKFETIKSNYDNWLSLRKELQEYSRKKEHLELVKNLLKGNGFIEYISEERLRYIAKEASETLGTLTRHRYGLELDIENGFVIRDDSNGGIRRPVTTLSGGETFLTSLSLALALSSQIQLKGQSPLEFFFLDEGFGTLDSSLLDTVIDALERLSTKERVIGLISHVPELKNRITRRLVVESPVINGTGSKIYMEKA